MEAKDALLEELCRDTPNVLTVRQICRHFFMISLPLHCNSRRDNKDIIGFLGIRVKIWSLLLLGQVHPVGNEVTLTSPSDRCKEQHVLDADVPRTRSDIEVFRTTAWRSALVKILQHFCLSHNIQ